MYIVHEYLSPVGVCDMILYIWHISPLAVHYSRMYIVHGYLSPESHESCHVHPLEIDIHVQCTFYCNVQPVEIDVKCVTWDYTFDLIIYPLAVHKMRIYIVHEYLSPLAVHYSRMYIVHGYLSPVGHPLEIDIHVQCTFYCNVQPVEIDVKCIISCHIHPLEMDIHVQCTFYCNVQPVEIYVTWDCTFDIYLHWLYITIECTLYMDIYLQWVYVTWDCTFDIYLHWLIDIKCIIWCHIHPLEIDIHVQCIFYCNIQPVEIDIKCLTYISTGCTLQ
jgi:hypothetical protein